MGHHFKSAFGTDPNDTSGDSIYGSAAGAGSALGGVTGTYTLGQINNSYLSNHTLQNTYQPLQHTYQPPVWGHMSNTIQSAPPSIKDRVYMTAADLNSPEMECDLTAAKDMWAVRFGTEWVRREAFKDDETYIKLCYRLVVNNELEEVYLYDCRDYSYKIKR